jgi:hypothetical protein
MAKKYLDKKIKVVVYSMMDETTGVGFGYKEGAPNKQDKVGDCTNTTIAVGDGKYQDITAIYGTTSGGIIIEFGGNKLSNINKINLVAQHPSVECKLPEVSGLTWDDTNSYYTVTDPDTAELFKNNRKDCIHVLLEFVS